jgi:hypothetical protein
MKHFYIPILILLVLACTEEHEQSKSIKDEPEEVVPDIPFEDRVKVHVQSQLQIPGGEEYTLKIYKEQMTEDGIEDAIITVNRLNYAMEKAKKKNLVKSAEYDFLGGYNILFYYDSELDKITPPLSFTSTPYRELKVSFENISSTAYKDPIIDYPIRNSEFRIFLPIVNHAPKSVMQWKVYDGWGTDAVEAYCFEYEKSNQSTFKDIVIKKASLKNIGRDENYNEIKPEISCGTETVKRFWFNPQDNKYYGSK